MKMLRVWRAIIVKLVAAWKSREYFKVTGSSVSVVLTKYHVKTSWQDKFTEVLAAYIISSISATGNIMVEAYYENGDTSTMWLLERWRNQVFYNDNKRSIASKAVDALVKIGLESPADTIFIKDLDLFSKEVPWNTTGTNDQPVTIMVIIEVKQGTENYFKSINHDLMLALKNEHGVLFFQFGQLVYDTSRFIVYKKFRNWQIFQQHLQEPALEPVMKFLQTSVKDPPFEKNYHHLIPFIA